MREIAIMKKLNHPNVVHLYEVIDDPRSNQVYLILEYYLLLYRYVEGGVSLPENNIKCRPIDTVFLYINIRKLHGNILEILFKV